MHQTNSISLRRLLFIAFAGVINLGRFVHGSFNARRNNLEDAVRVNDHTKARFAIVSYGNVNRKDKKGSTVLFFAKDRKMARLLVQNKANVNHANNDGCTPLHQFCRGGNIEMVQFLLESGANVKARSRLGTTCLMQAILSSDASDTELVKLLLKAGVDVNAFNSEGVSALLLAIEDRFANVVELLLRANADPNKANDAGLTPLKLANAQGSLKVVKLLLEYGAVAKADEQASLSIGDQKFNRFQFLLHKWRGSSRAEQLDVENASDLEWSLFDDACRQRNFKIMDHLIRTNQVELYKFDIQPYCSSYSRSYLDYFFRPDIYAKLNDEGQKCILWAHELAHRLSICDSLSDLLTRLFVAFEDLIERIHAAIQLSWIEIFHYTLTYIRSRISVLSYEKNVIPKQLKIFLKVLFYFVSDRLLRDFADGVKVIHYKKKWRLKIGARPFCLKTDRHGGLGLSTATYKKLLAAVCTDREMAFKFTDCRCMPVLAGCKNPNFALAFLAEHGKILAGHVYYGDAALITAVAKGHIELVIELLTIGENVNSIGSDGNPLLVTATKLGNSEMVELLLDCNADPNCSDRKGLRPLQFACKKGKGVIAEILINHRASVNQLTVGERSPLEFAVGLSSVKITKMLIENGAKLELLFLKGKPSITMKNYLFLTNPMLYERLGKKCKRYFNSGEFLSQINSKDRIVKCGSSFRLVKYLQSLIDGFSNELLGCPEDMPKFHVWMRLFKVFRLYLLTDNCEWNVISKVYQHYLQTIIFKPLYSDVSQEDRMRLIKFIDKMVGFFEERLLNGKRLDSRKFLNYFLDNYFFMFEEYFNVNFIGVIQDFQNLTI